MFMQGGFDILCNNIKSIGPDHLNQVAEGCTLI